MTPETPKPPHQCLACGAEFHRLYLFVAHVKSVHPRKKGAA
jgi:hypothetical protein